jgi:hypothetical protein
VLEIVKMLLGMDISDTSKDNLLNHFIKKATDIILGYCNIDALPEQYHDVAADLAVFLYNNRDLEGITKKTEGEKSLTIINAIPESIRLALPPPRIRVVG